MALTDNLIVKVIPATGDTFVKNLIDNSDAAANGAGTLALVDDAGLLGWNVQGARDGSFLGGIGYEGAAVTVAVRFKATSRLADYLTYFSVATSPTGNGFGAQVTNNGTTTGTLRLREAIGGSGFTVIGSPAYTAGNYFTAVIRLCDTTFSPATVAGFLKQAGRANNNPDYSLAAAEAVRSGFGVIDTLILGAAGQNLTFTDIAVWTRALTDAEAAAVADDIRGQLSVSADPSATLAWTEESDTSSITANVAVTNVTGTIAWTEASDTSASTATVASSTGTITTTAFKNNTGTVLANLTGLTVTVLNLATLSFVKTFTAQTTDASGVMTLNDALLVAGTEYAVVTTNAAKTLGVEKYTAT